MQESDKNLYNLIMSHMLVSLYKSNLNKEKELDIESLYFYLTGQNIKNENKNYIHSIGGGGELFITAAYDIAERLGVQHFTNPDLKIKDYTSILIHNIYCDNEHFYQKIEHLLSIEDTNVFLNFMNVDSASVDVLHYVENLSRQNFANFLFTFTSKEEIADLRLNALAIRRGETQDRATVTSKKIKLS